MKLLLRINILLIFLGTIACTSEDLNLNPDASNEAYHNGSGPILGLGGDVYDEIIENGFIKVEDEALSTFSIDADGASYANVRRYLEQDNQLPPKDAVRTEELINYFELNYPYQDASHPINLHAEYSTCPWSDHNLLRIGIKGKPITRENLGPANYVLLMDVSGSMSSGDKLDLLKQGFNAFVDEIDANDRIAIVTYAGSAGLVLESTSGDQKSVIKDAINGLGSGGSTAGAEGIITAYDIAEDNFIEGGNNRIIIGTDGDFNVGPSSKEELIELIEEKREKGIFLTVLGVGRGNLNDAALEQIANNGNGTYEYIDNLKQMEKIFRIDYSKFFTVAKDVKVQVRFNPERIDAYRLIGYENRALTNEEFEDDQKDAGEIGANQNITALYEIIPASTDNSDASNFTIDYRYKEPDSDSSVPLSLSIYGDAILFPNASEFMKFTSSVAGFSSLLRESEYIDDVNFDDILTWLDDHTLEDEHGFKAELRSLIEKAKNL